MQNRVIFFGCGGHAKSVADVYLLSNPNAEIVFVDNNAKPNEKILGFDVVVSYNVTNEKVFASSGSSEIRARILSNYFDNAINVISPNAYVGRDVSMSRGIFIAHGAHVGIESEIKIGAIINTNASIDHEVTIGEYTHLAPNTTVCGKVEIGNNCLIGAGSIIIPNIKLDNDIVIGAGSVICRSYSKSGTIISNIKMSYR